MAIDTSLEISPNKFHDKLQSGEQFLLIDVRGKPSYDDWHIFDSEHYPIMSLITSKSYPEEYKNKKIITICGKGNDSRMAARQLQNHGLNAVSLQGGLTKWMSVFNKIELPINDKELKIVQFRRVAKGCLSYILISGEEAIIIDPAYNNKTYIDYIEENDLQLKQVYDTHLHADHVSGAKPLAELMDATVYFPEKDPFEFEFSPLKDGQEISLNGKVIGKAMHTPGHTKGSTSIKIKNFGLFTGDTVFVDGIGRPDLANKVKEFAGDLYNSINNKIAKLPKDMEIAPAHNGSFTLDHFHQPIVTTIEDLLQDKIMKKNEIEFIGYAVEKVKTVPHPPSYEKIRDINAGKMVLSAESIQELEIGPNRCAISK